MLRLRRVQDIGGFTIIEVLVVMGIIAILAAVTIPLMTSGGGVMSRAELPRTAQIIQTKLQAAQMYANTYRVDTAVVYSLDNWVSPAVDPSNTGALQEPITDTLFLTPARAIVAAAVMYKLPDTLGNLSGIYAPVPTDEGAFEIFPGNNVLLLEEPSLNHLSDPLYKNMEPRYVRGTEGTSLGNFLYILGMGDVQALTQNVERGVITASQVDWFPAHRFSRVGKLQISREPKERYIIHAAPSPAAEVSERYVYADTVENIYLQTDPSNRPITVPIEIFRSTGRVRLGQ